MKIPSPIIIIGMHRSGTSLLAKVLEKAGIFMGVIKDHNYEAMHFLSLNQQTLWAANANWLEPKVPEKIYWKKLPADLILYEHFKIYSRLQRLKYRILRPRWGWKDPRNTFTLPMWLSEFPDARVIHVVRDSTAVAKSLAKRNTIIGEVHDPRLQDLQFNENLWKKYVGQGRSYAPLLGDRYFEISYEDMVSLSSQRIRDMEKFTGVKLYGYFEEYVR